MKHLRHFADGFIQIAIVYAVAVYIVEMEYFPHETHLPFFGWSDRVLALIFTIEYFTRWVASRRWTYPFTLLAIIDLLALLPFYHFTGLIDLRSLRVLRTFRILSLLKLYRYSHALQNLYGAVRRVGYEFGVMGLALLTVVWISAAAVWEFEHEQQPEKFAKLSDAVWYVVVTITTVGYGDKVPETPGGKLVGMATMLTGLGVFGTFISLTGSAFVEELRESIRKRRMAEVPLPADVQALGHADFDPVAVLGALDTASRGGNKPPPAETERLLRAACLALLIRRESG